MYILLNFISLIFLCGTLYTLAYNKEIYSGLIISYNVSSCLIVMILGLITLFKPEIYIKKFYFESKFKYKKIYVRLYGIMEIILGIFIFYIIFIDKKGI